MKHICLGIMAHVDAGKTTLSEGLLYAAGALRRPGRVDHGDAFLDTDAQERERGITIFSKQAVFEHDDTFFTLLDTPGHADFSAEAERAVQVMDCAVLVISASDGVQSHTRTLWKLLARHRVPVLLFINKTDLPGFDREALMAQLRAELDATCVDFAYPERDEQLATASEAALEEYLSDGALSDGHIRRLIAQRAAFPCFFGAALRQEGVEDFLSALSRWTSEPPRAADFGAQVFKITRDAQGARLTWLKLTGGMLRVKDTLPGSGEKVEQLRLYSGAKFRPLDAAQPGMVVAVVGPRETQAGQALGSAVQTAAPLLEPVLTYRLLLPEGVDPVTALPKLRELAEEDPQLRLVWNEHTRELHMQLMGPIQLEILERLIRDRYGYDVHFGTGSIVYRETIESTVEGVGHFEPLRHYAEVHLLLEPLARGSGVQLCSAVSTDVLDLNWQRLILTHLAEREHPGVLTGSALTDVRITLAAGRAHLKHTEGGDFRQATYRAVRQGLMQAKSILLEPHYDFRIELPPECLGRAMNDISQMGGVCDDPEVHGTYTLLTGHARVAGLADYAAVLSVYTRGRGRLSCTLRGYEPCRMQDEVVAAIGYDPERDTENPTGSVFCSHGAGDYVPWNEVFSHMHLPAVLQKPKESVLPDAPVRRSAPSALGYEQDRELQGIFERTYGKVERPAFQPRRTPARTALDDAYDVRLREQETEYLLVDGYNIIFAWDELKRLAAQDISAARAALVDILSDYQAFRRCVLILVFDAYKVKGNPGSVEKVNGLSIVYTREAETADSYIEKATYALRGEGRVRVATSDNLEQLIILGHGALRISAQTFHAEVEQARGEIADLIARYNLRGTGSNTLRSTARIVRRD